jgi:uncharacterized membrane protein
VTFAQPLWLWLLPLLVPLVLLLHARRRRDLPVASLVVWRRVPATAAATPQRRRFPWRDPRLWLQLLAVAGAVVALAGPSLGAGSEPVHWVVVVDASTTMNAIDVTPSRFDGAVATLMARWGAVEGRDLLSIVRAGPAAHVVAARWPVGPGLAGAVAALGPADGAPDWFGAAERVAWVGVPSDVLRVVVLTDAYGAAAARAAFGGDVDVVVFGDALVNVGVGDVAAVPRGRADQWLVTGRVATVGVARGETVRVVAAFRPIGGDTFLPWGAADAVLDADGTATFELPLDLPGPGEVEVRGPSGDRLAADDRALLVLRPTPIRVAVVGPLVPALLRALAAIGGLEVFAADTVPDPDAAAAFDLVIVTGPVAGVPATSTWWFGDPPAGLAVGDALTAPLPPIVLGAHPLMRDVDPAALTVERAVPLALPVGATALLVAGDATLAWARTTSSGRQVVVGFGADDGDWTSQLSFPAFVAAVVDWAAPRVGQAGCRVGAACPWPREAFAGGWSLADPTGRTIAGDDALTPVAGDPLASAVWDEARFDLGFTPERAGRHGLVTDAGQIGLPVATSPIGGAPVAESSVAAEVGSSAPRDLTRWLALAALAFAVADVVAAFVGMPLAARRRAWRPWALAGLAVAAWAFAAFGLPLPRPGPGGHVVWVAPVAAGGEVADAARAAPTWASSWVGLQPIGAAPPPADVPPDAWTSDVAAALEVALALPAAGAPRHRVVANTVGATLSATQWAPLARRALAAGIAVDVLDAGASGGAAVAADPAETFGFTLLQVPEGVRSGARFALAVGVQAPGGAAWRVTADLVAETPAQPGVGEAVPEAPAASERSEAAGVGAASVAVDLQAGAQGELQYRVSLHDGDRLDPVAVATVAVTVGPRPNVLVVTNDAVQGARLIEGLQAQAIDVRSVTPFRMPSSLAALSAYDAVALVNVPASEVFSAYQDMLETYVREVGGGLLLFGGPTAFGPGGYFRTPLEELSPLSAQITEDAPEVSLAFVLDRSGSMNGAVGSSTRMDVAKLATLEALELLGEQSQAAIIVFDTEAQVLLPLSPVSDVPAFEAALTAVRAAGGTSIYPGLVAAYDLMRASDAATRHVVVMTDGLSQEGDFPGVLGALTDIGIATSFVGVGDAADRLQLTTLANLSGGALHFARDFRALPSLLAQEALMLSATPISEGPTRADWVAGGVPDFLTGVLAGPPPLLQGYVRTTAKPEADVHLVERSEDDPLLASWRYGLGRVVAFASEVDGPWAEAWTAAPEFARLWSQTVRWTAERAVRDAWSLQVAGSDGRLDVAVDHPRDVAPEAFVGRAVDLLDADGATLASRRLERASDGRLVASFEIAGGWQGTATLRFDAASDLGLATPLVRSVAWPLAPLPPLRSDDLPLERLARATGGDVIEGGGARLPAVAAPWRWRALPEAWLLAGLLLFLIGLMLRYGAWSAWFGRSARVR